MRITMHAKTGHDTDMGAWMLSWLGGPVIGVANGVARRALYEKPLGEQRAHQLSTVIATGLFARYIYLLDRRWPIATAGDAVRIGVAWAGATAAFEFGFGHYIARAPWKTLLRDYDLSHGRLWSLVIGTLAVGPSLAYQARTRRETPRRNR
jgi:hypothetical protein